MEEPVILRNIADGAGTQFDPAIVNVFMNAFGKLRAAFAAAAA
jgi:HD-GYP domain-containing protein (c-di-GMP phosphodiesterase class II)